MKRILDILKHWGEYVPFFLALFAWWFSRYVTVWIDPTAAVDDAGLIQAFLFKAMCFFGAVSFAWVVMRLAFPRVMRYMDEEFGKPFDFSKGDVIQYDDRPWLAMMLFIAYLLTAAIIFA